jgi:2-polyprenyl-3-methyl-5-hydroxy-6-metoxy-1,4-benzoquinol methylase
MSAPSTTTHGLAIQMAQGSSSAFHLEHTLSMIEEYHVQPGRLLDFGAGNGALLQALQAKGFVGCGLDALQRPPHLHAAISWTVGNLNDDLPMNLVTGFDCVTAIEVIEHLENPRHCLRSLLSALRPGGTLILSSPNVLSLRSILSLLCRGHFVDFLDSSYPAHITPVLPMDAQRILREFGQMDFRFSFSNRGVLPSCTSLSWQSLSFGLLNGVRFSDHWFMVARKSVP